MGTVTLSQVRELASLLIDIHGQHEHQSLLHKKNHLQILDEYAKEKLAPYKEKGAHIFADYAQIRKKLEASTLDEAARKKEMDFLQFEVDEVDYETTERGEAFKGTEVSRKSIGNFVAKILENPAPYARKDFGVDKPGTDGDKPAWY